MIVSIQKKGYSTDDWRKSMIVSIQKKGYSTDDWRRRLFRYRRRAIQLTIGGRA